MKKLSTLLCVFLVAISLSACQTFYDDVSKNYPQDNPLSATIFLQIKSFPTNSTIDAELTNWLTTIRAMNAAITDTNATKILTVEPRDTTNDNNAYTIDLTIQNPPDLITEKTIRPFKITYTQTVFNPITLLPNSNTFNYVVAYTSQRRHSAANSDQIVAMGNGDYGYFWTSDKPIKFVDNYPNRPLYYLIILVSAGIVGSIVYFISRYYDCKKRKNHL